MKNEIHPDYEMMADLYDEREIREKPISRREEPKFERELQRSLIRRKKRHLHYNLYLYVVIYFASMVVLYFSLTSGATTTVKSTLPPIISEIGDIPKSDNADLAHEVELMKSVIANLALTVEKLTVPGAKVEQPKVEEFKPGVIQIVVPKGILRDSPSVDAGIVASLKKDALLMGLDHKDGWIKTLAPSGKEAWIQISMVNRVETKE